MLIMYHKRKNRMAKSRKGLGKIYGKNFKEKKVRDAKRNVHSGRGSNEDFDIVFEDYGKKFKKKHK